MSSAIPARAAPPLALVLALGVVLVVVGLFGSGCEPGHGVTFRNETDQRLSVYQYGRYSFTLEPSQETTASVFTFRGQTSVEAKDENGNVVYSQSFTWQELKEANWEIVIARTPVSAPASAPSSTASPTTH